jgi:hypothetical protein
MNENRSPELRLLAAAIQMVRQHVRWKPGKDVQHLEKRIRRVIFRLELGLINITNSFKNTYRSRKQRLSLSFRTSGLFLHYQ